MKIEYRPDGILDATERYIIHGCNAQGAMGSGVAKVLMDRYPNVRELYLGAHARAKKNNEKFLGTLHYCPNTPHHVINAITQEFYGRDGALYVSYEAVLDAFEKLNEEAVRADRPNELYPAMDAVAMPLIGCGLAGGDWNIVREIIETTAQNYQPVVYLNGAPVPA
jgi:O-acetyl-ADP-ribose deacetylase (regulator of RNase III)